MFNKLICFVLVFSLVLSLVIPASASTDSSFLVDLFSYNLGMGSPYGFSVSGWNFSGTSGRLAFPLPADTPIYYVDIFLYLTDGIASQLSFSCGDSALTSVVFGDSDNFIRVFGHVEAVDYSAISTNHFFLDVSSSSSFACTVMGFKFSPTLSPFEVVPGKQVLKAEGDNHTWYGTSLYTWYVEQHGLFSYSIWIEDWKSFDYLDVVSQVSFYGLSSVAVYVDGGGSVPFTYSFIEGAPQWYNNVNLISIALDLRDVPRDIGDAIIIEYSGELNLGATAFRTFPIFGYISSSFVDPDITWLSRIHSEITRVGNMIVTSFLAEFRNIANLIATWGQNIVTAIVGDPQTQPGIDSSQIEEDTDNINDALDSLDEILVKPDIDDINLVPFNPVSDANYLRWVTILIGESSPFAVIVQISLALMLGSYVLFGKKG